MSSNWNGKRVFVTGSAGVIGQELMERLSRLGAVAVGADLKRAERKVEGARHIIADLSEGIPAEIDDFDPQVVFHLAATFERSEESADFWPLNFRHNVLLTHNLHRALERYPSLSCFAFASSYLIYSPALYFDRPAVQYLKETDSISPRNLTGVAKYLGERELDFLSGGGSRFRAVSARIYRVYGCGSRDIISRWIRSALAGERLEVYGRANRFDYIYAADVAEGLLQLAASGLAAGVVNLGSGIPHSISEVVSYLGRMLPGLEVRQREEQLAVEASCADMARFAEITGARPQTTLEEGIRKIVAYESARSLAVS